MLITIGLLWVFYDFVSHHLPRPGYVAVSVWLYFHLLLTMRIDTVGASVFNLVAHAEEHLPSEVRWLLVAATGIILISIDLLMRTIQLSTEHQRTNRFAGRVTLISAVLYCSWDLLV